METNLQTSTMYFNEVKKLGLENQNIRNYELNRISRKRSMSEPSSAEKINYVTSSSLHSPLTCKKDRLNELIYSAERCDADFTDTPPNDFCFTNHHYIPVSKAYYCSPLTTSCNRLTSLLTSTPACKSCLTPSPMLVSTDDMSPITRSTQRMTKAMQVCVNLYIVLGQNVFTLVKGTFSLYFV